MKRIGIFIALLVALIMQINAAVPKWMNEELRGSIYGKTTYFTGFALIQTDHKEPLDKTIDRAKLSARAELVSTIRVQVERLITDSMRNVWEAGSAHTSDVNTAITTLRTGLAEIPGLQIEHYIDEQNNFVAAFAYVRIEGLNAKLQRQLLLLLGRTDLLEEEAELCISNNQRQKAREVVASIHNELDKIDETRLTMIAVDAKISDEDLMTTEWRATRLKLVDIESQLNRSCKVSLSCVTTNAEIDGTSLPAMISGELSKLGCLLVDSKQAEWTIKIDVNCQPYQKYQDGEYIFYFTHNIATIKIYNQQKELIYSDQLVVKGAHTLSYSAAAADGLRQLAQELSKQIINTIQL